MKPDCTKFACLTRHFQGILKNAKTQNGQQCSLFKKIPCSLIKLENSKHLEKDALDTLKIGKF